MKRFSSSLILAITVAGSFALASRSVSAQTSFSAEVEGRLTRPDSPCPEDAFRCGDAHVAGYGEAVWRFFLISFAPVSDSCGEYEASVTFTLFDSSTLTLGETGTVCGPGKSFFATPPFSWGNPDRATGTWQVIDGDGQFSELTGGGGTNTGRSTGASLRGSYVGFLEE